MKMDQEEGSISREMLNGGGAAAVLAAGAGSFVLAMLAIAAGHISQFRQELIFYRRTGPLSGVTTCVVVIWLAIWAILHLRWRNRTVAIGRISILAVILLCLGVVLTFPPVADLF